MGIFKVSSAGDTALEGAYKSEEAPFSLHTLKVVIKMLKNATIDNVRLRVYICARVGY